MKFLVDAHLPPGLCGLLQAAGHDALHTSQLPAQNRTTDRVINELSLQQQRAVVTKDSDFYNTHLLRGEPWKLLGMPGVERVPRSQWKLYYLRRIDPAKRLAPKNCINRNLDYDALLADRPASLLPGRS